MNEEAPTGEPVNTFGLGDQGSGEDSPSFDPGAVSETKVPVRDNVDYEAMDEKTKTHQYFQDAQEIIKTLGGGYSVEAFAELLAEPRQMSPEMQAMLDMVSLRLDIEKETAGMSPEQVVSKATQGLVDFAQKHPHRDITNLGLTIAGSVGRKTEQDGVIPGVALNFMTDMLKMKAAAQPASKAGA